MDSIYDSEPDVSFLDLDENGNNNPRMPNHRRDEFDIDAVPFQPRFLLQGLVFVHCAYLQRPYVHGNLLCREDWLSLGGGSAGCECTIPAALGDCKLLNESRRCTQPSEEGQLAGVMHRASSKELGGLWSNHIFSTRLTSAKFTHSVVLF